eukprot:1161220-Pelagomonas_calceolata.AAC.5
MLLPMCMACHQQRVVTAKGCGCYSGRLKGGSKAHRHDRAPALLCQHFICPQTLVMVPLSRTHLLALFCDDLRASSKVQKSTEERKMKGINPSLAALMTSGEHKAAGAGPRQHVLLHVLARVSNSKKCAGAQ